MSTDPRPRGARGARAFTLTELLIAVGAVAILTVGIGQIFRSVSRLTSQSQALAETDQIARQVERAFRADIEAFNRVAPEDNFLVIRMREVGDLDRNNTLDLGAGDRPIYISRDDLDADIAAGLAPYQSATIGTGTDKRTSRAVTTRVDEVAFLGLAPPGKPYLSAQPMVDVYDTTLINRLDPPPPAPSAPAARIQWGHALRTRVVRDSNRDASSNPAVTASIQREWPWVPDGDFGSWAFPYFGASAQVEQVTPRAGTPARYQGVTVQPFPTAGRNQFAGNWLLARQALLLVGGNAAGEVALNNTVGYPTGRSRTYAPTIRDLDNWKRFGIALDRYNPPTTQNPLNGPASDSRAAMIFQGRTDICAQTLEDAKRWLEGEAFPAPYPVSGGATNWLQPPFAATYSSGPYCADVGGLGPVSGTFLTNPGAPPSGAPSTLVVDVNKPLWQRSRGRPTTVPDNALGLRSAVAGVLGRLLQDAEPPPIYRVLNTASTATVPPAEQSSMDTHAVFAGRCSRFEVAWSNGARAKADIVYPNSSPPRIMYRAGDLIFFDLSTLDPLPGVAGTPRIRNTYDFWLFHPDMQQARDRTVGLTPRTMALNASNYPAESPRAEIPSGVYRRTGNPADAPITALINRLNLGSAVNRSDVGAFYDPVLSMGDPGAGANQPLNEVLAVWPFRVPTPDGGLGKAWPKPTHLRVRVTLHDSQFRLQETVTLPNGTTTTRSGRTYEYIFTLGPDGPA